MLGQDEISSVKTIKYCLYRSWVRIKLVELKPENTVNYIGAG